MTPAELKEKARYLCETVDHTDGAMETAIRNNLWALWHVVEEAAEMETKEGEDNAESTSN